MRFGKIQLLTNSKLSNSYLFSDRLNLQVDAGSMFNRKVDILVLTHCHYDHIAYANEIKRKNQDCKIMCGRYDAKAIATLSEATLINRSPIKLTPVNIDKKLKTGDEIRIGDFRFSVIETPGHTIGSISLYEKHERILLTGDTWFGGDVCGRTDFPTGSETDMNISVKKLKKLKAKLILPGHNALPTNSV